jgi:hypothetical protein
MWKAALVVMALAGCDRVFGLDNAPPGIDATPLDGLVDTAVAPPNIAFVTSATFVPANLGGAAGADAMCTTIAHGAGYAGQYIAWLSTSTSDARTRIEGARGWLRTDGRPFADQISDIVDGKLWYPLRIDETKHDLGTTTDDADLAVATQTNSKGLYIVGGGCSDFSDTVGEVEDGFADAGPAMWSAAVQQSCTTPAHLYCFGTDRQLPVAITAETTKLAFVSNADFGVGSGRVFFDNLCVHQALDALLDGHFSAALPVAGSPTMDRFSNGPWARTDGVTAIAADGTFVAPLDLDASGLAELGNRAFAGATSLTASPDMTCNSWLTFDTSVVGVGLADRSSPRAYANDTAQCTSGQRFYCMQDD